jgi:alkanesulfonate monooxygenase SsuD/methylene tetrahydromethanopterin reductase-like flavin-dependent oxidoreductase (luciferase family)
MALRRERVKYDGEFFTLPLPDGPGKALTLTVHPVRDYIPMYLAAVGPKNLELAGELFDGWLAIFYAPETASEHLAHISVGRAKVGKTIDAFDVVPTVPVVIGNDLDACAAPVRAYAALYIGGMGSREQNFYNQLAVRMGYEAEATEIQDRYLAKDYAGAASAVPMEFIDRTALIGPRERIRDRLHAYAEAGVTTLTAAIYTGTLDEQLATLRTLAEVLDEAGLAS